MLNKEGIQGQYMSKHPFIKSPYNIERGLPSITQRNDEFKPKCDVTMPTSSIHTSHFKTLAHKISQLRLIFLRRWMKFAHLDRTRPPPTKKSNIACQSYITGGKACPLPLLNILSSLNSLLPNQNLERSIYVSPMYQTSLAPILKVHYEKMYKTGHKNRYGSVNF